MLPLIGGIIVLVLFVSVGYMFIAPVFNKVGAFVINKTKPFKNQEENINE